MTLSNELVEQLRRLLPPVTDPQLLEIAGRYVRGEVTFTEFEAQSAACRERRTEASDVAAG